MDERALVETAARVICAERWNGHDEAWPSYQAQARAVVAALRRAVEGAIAERCARVCDHLGHELQAGDEAASEAAVITSINEAVGAQKCAQAIRALAAGPPGCAEVHRRSAHVRARQPNSRGPARVSGDGPRLSLWSRLRLSPMPQSARGKQGRAAT